MHYELWEDVCVDGKIIKKVYRCCKTKFGVYFQFLKWKWRNKARYDQITFWMFNDSKHYILNDGNVLSVYVVLI